MPRPVIVGSIDIAAPPAAVYRLISDLASWSRFAAETRISPEDLPLRLEPGATFRAWNHAGAFRWRTTTTVLYAEPSRTLAFAVRAFGMPVSTWRYDIVPTLRGSRVTESTRDSRGGLLRLFSVLFTGVGDRDARNRHNIDLTLVRLRAAAEGTA
ncbi:SRPBCC family protein [Streptomyces tagetis]|uniref:SRPBCC family protein n=1 Tax=Streptomyces tagetis TaxID=2820809 RepID=A0A941B6N2_9ACTN|nr:SRPBCC family protein [Streptomyces sp. RG38]MBQ0826558.1 SRPBCC family protein [Streptomyces sp. RG38]